MKQNKLCAVISGGVFSELNGIEKADYIIACDKGYEYAVKCAVKPDILVGDFDSYKGELPSDIPRLSLPAEKDDTDTLAAIRYALAEGYREINLYCAGGGRLDHLFANIQSAAFAVLKGAKVRLIDDDNQIIFFSNSSVKLPPKKGWSLSVFSVTDKCTFVNERGVKYPLEDAVIKNTFPIGVSNEWEGTAEISVKDGVLAVMLSKIKKEYNA